MQSRSVITLGWTLAAVICPGCASEGSDRERLDRLAVEQCTSDMMLPLMPLEKARRALAENGFLRGASDESDLLKFFKSAGKADVPGGCDLRGLGPVQTEVETWTLPTGGPKVSLTVVKPENWVVEYSVFAYVDRMPALWGPGAPSGGAFSDAYVWGFVVAGNPPQCDSGARQALAWVDAKWQSDWAEIAASGPPDKVANPDFGPVHVLAMSSAGFKGFNGFANVNVIPHWGVVLSCRGSWAEARAVLQAGAWPTESGATRPSIPSNRAGDAAATEAPTGPELDRYVRVLQERTESVDPAPAGDQTSGVAEPEARAAPSGRTLLARELTPVASSELTERSGFVNAVPRLFDGDDDTAWAEGVTGPGVGEWFGADFASEHTVTGLLLGIGHAKQSKRFGDLFVLNSRPRQVSVAVGGWTQTWELADDRADQALSVPAVRGGGVRLTIEDVYAGARWPDTTVHSLAVLVAEDR